MAPRRDAAWLTTELTKALGWDAMVIEGVVAAISNAQTDEEVQELVVNFMGDNQTAKRLISQFLEAQRGRASSYSASVSSSSAAGAGSSQGADAERDPQAGWVVYRKGEQEPLGDEYAAATAAAGAGAAGQTSPPPKQAQPRVQQVTSPEPSKTSAAKQHAEATLAMFRKGGRLRTSGAGGGSKQRSAGGGDGAQGGPVVERQVVNCLSCGKVYDCRGFTNDIIRFLDQDGTCTFCGTRVALTYAERGTIPGQTTAAATSSATAAAAAAAVGTQPQPGTAPTIPPVAPGVAAAAAAAEAAAAAAAFKDRLVDYDRNSAKRTSVIDDQSDYFEIDANAWLTDEERREMRERRRIEQEAAEMQKSKRFTVTLDLIGRQVLLENDFRGNNQAAAAAPAAARTAAATSTALPADAAFSAVAGPSTADAAQGANQSAEALAKALAAVRDMRIRMNPNLATAPPVFVPRRQQQQQQAEQAAGSSGSGAPVQTAAAKAAPAAHKRSAPAAPADGPMAEPVPKAADKGGPREARASSRAAKAKRRDAGRVQDDDVFQQFEASLLSEELATSQLLQSSAA